MSSRVACSHRFEHQGQTIAGTHLHPDIADDHGHAISPVVRTMRDVDAREHVVPKIGILTSQASGNEDHPSLYAHMTAMIDCTSR